MKKQIVNSKAFTLIELLVVIAIIGILAAAVLVAINPGQRIGSSRNAKVKSDLENLARAASVFNADTATVSCTGGASYPDIFNIGVPPAAQVCGGTFIASPLDPNGAVYDYEVTPSGCAPNVTACTAFAIAGPQFSDGTTVATTTSLWCYRSATGQLTSATNDAGCNP